MEIIRLSKKINICIGNYKTHYLTEKRQFMVQLSNGTMEVDINLARECEVNPENIISYKLHEVASSYQTENKKRKNLKAKGDRWNQVFRSGKEGDEYH